MTSWLEGEPSETPYPVVPEIEKLRGKKLVCFYGSKDDDVVCPKLDTLLVKSIELPGGHLVKKHFDPIASEILNDIK
jgi:type IV secretory pathway VirJ component